MNVGEETQITSVTVSLIQAREWSSRKPSLRRTRHLLGDEQVDLPAVVFIVGKTLVNLRPRELREAPCRQPVNRFAILQKANDDVDADSGAFHYGVAASHARRAHDVPIGLRNPSHDLMLWFTSPSVNDLQVRMSPGLQGSHCD